MDYIAITALTYYYYSKDKDLIITLVSTFIVILYFRLLF
jgi:hypothetical protein